MAKKKLVHSISIVGGAGHVGLPLSLVLSSIGFKISIIDIDVKKIKQLKKGIFPFKESNIEKYKKELKKIIYTNKISEIKNSQTIIFTAGTPIDDHLNPKFDSVFDIINQMIPFLNNNHNLILRSTLFPGTSNLINENLKKNGLNVNLSFCPERIAQGNAINELSRFPQIISGNNTKAIKNSKYIFSKLTNDIIELSLEEAELTKLFNNSWRYLKFSIANQFYQICISQNLDFQKIRNAMMFNYERAADFPNSGFSAGPCLFKDTMQLASYSSKIFTLGHSAMLVNESMPEFLVDKIKETYKIQNSNVGILGMAFKPDNDDKRESLAYKLAKVLKYQGANVFSHDPYIKSIKFVSIDTLLKKCKILILGCPHKIYKNIKLKKNQKIIDCWGFYNNSLF